MPTKRCLQDLEHEAEWFKYQNTDWSSFLLPTLTSTLHLYKAIFSLLLISYSIQHLAKLTFTYLHCSAIEHTSSCKLCK